MGLTSSALLYAVGGLALALPLALVLLWLRGPGRRAWWGAAAVAGGVVIAQAVAVGAVAVAVNRQYGFYPTWDALLGQPAPPPVVALPSPRHPALASRSARRVASAAKGVGYLVPRLPTVAGGGSYREYVITGASSRITQRVIVWLPPQYNARRFASSRFPVLMVLGGAYSPVTWAAERLDFDRLATGEIKHGGVAPFIAVFPELNVAGHTDTECTDVPHGLQAFTWLAGDVPGWAEHALRVRSHPHGWSVMGWSTGGYCAAKLHLRDPSGFVAAASFEGYFTPELDRSTGNLQAVFHNSIRLANDNSPLWLVEHRPPPAAHILVSTSPSDPQSYDPSMTFLRRTHAIPGVQPYVVHDLGHTVAAWQLVTPPILGWLAAVAGL